jgi:four helix bundle protein
MGNFQNLSVWQRAKTLAVRIYQITNKYPALARDLSMVDQLRRAAVSAPSNIAEGDELRSNKQSIHYFYIAKGSIAELKTQLIIVQALELAPKTVTEPEIQECYEIGAMLYALIQARQRSPRQV